MSLRALVRDPGAAFSDARAVLLHRRAVQVISLGHQKSGTTAVAALLAAAIDARLANDPFYFIDQGSASTLERIFQDKGELRTAVMSHRRRFCQPVLKDPDLTFLYPESKMLFSNARAFFVVRDPRSMIRSIADRLKLSAADLARPAGELELPNRHWQLICAGTLPATDGETVAEVLAHRWSLAAQCFLNHRAELPLVVYERFVADKMSVIRNLIGELGLPLRRDISGLLDVQFQPKGNSRSPLADRLGIESLGRIVTICEPLMPEFGYQPG